MSELRRNNLLLAERGELTCERCNYSFMVEPFTACKCGEPRAQRAEWWAYANALNKRLRAAEAERDRLREALQELVKLKGIKEAEGATPEYLATKEAAWESARRALEDSDG
jgi:hypothetical protein